MRRTRKFPKARPRGVRNWRRNWRRDWRRWVAATVVAALALPVPLIATLRWVHPVTSAYMLRAEAPHNRWTEWTEWNAIAPVLPLAVIAAEDQEFLEHAGFDLGSIRDAIRSHRRGGRLRGASTLSQQVAKNLFLWPGRSLVRKGLEAYLTLWIEALWSKRRILEVYLNIAEFGPGIFGVGAAAPRMLHSRPDALTVRQAALLAAVLPNPKRLRAEAPSPFLEERVTWIETQMRRLGGTAYLTRLGRQ